MEHTLHFLGLQTVHLNKVSPFFCTPHWGFLLALDWWQLTFVDSGTHMRWPSVLSCNVPRLVPNSGPLYLLSLLLWIIFFQIYKCLSSSFHEVLPSALPEALPQMFKLSPSPSESNPSITCFNTTPLFSRTLRNTWNTLNCLLMWCVIPFQDNVWLLRAGLLTMYPQCLAYTGS